MADAPKIYRCGSLTYTRPKLAILLFWLLWGDFCYMLMETVTPSIMPLKLKALGASNTSMALILSTVPWIVSMFLNPVISFKSDRFRSRWGRRIPFILFSLPFLVLCLISMGFGDRIGFWLHGNSGTLLSGFSPNTVALAVLAVTIIAFTFFNTFVNSTFWYLFNDVVPEELLARFMSWFRTVVTLTSALYSFFIFQFAETHAAEIFLGAGLLYFFGFGLMCLFVKEGEYPPPAPNIDGRAGLVSEIKTYAKECHSLAHYWYQFLCTIFSSIATGAGMFGIFFNQAIGLDLHQIGIIAGCMQVAGAVLILGSGWLADRYHPIRVVMAGVLIQVVLQIPIGFVWLFWHPAPSVAFQFMLIFNLCIVAPVGALSGVWDPPLFMRLFPRSRYGQFCSANAIWRAFGAIIGGTLAGVFLDVMKRFAGTNSVYLFLPLWYLLFNAPVAFFVYKLYRSWQKYGGDAAYVAPVPGDSRLSDAAGQVSPQP